MEMTDELRDQLKAECNAYRKELEALSADELMKRYLEVCVVHYDKADYKVKDGKLWYKYFEDLEVFWDYEWNWMYDATDPDDRKTVIKGLMTAKKHEIQSRLDQSEQRVEPKPKLEPAEDKDKKSEDEKDKKFWIGFFIFTMVGLMIALIVAFTYPI